MFDNLNVARKENHAHFIQVDMREGRYVVSKQTFGNARFAESLDEACKLLELGFEYVCEQDGLLYFRKRK